MVACLVNCLEPSDYTPGNEYQNHQSVPNLDVLLHKGAQWVDVVATLLVATSHQRRLSLSRGLLSALRYSIRLGK